MRTRRRLTILIYTICALLVVEGLGWVTYQALRLEAEAQFQGSVSLALWRMESELTPLISQEAARPYFWYRPFYVAERAYNRMWQELQQGEFLVPSPLLESTGPLIRLHFQVEPDGSITSPQAPTGNMRDLAESKYVEGEMIVLAGERLEELTAIVRAQGVETWSVFGLGMPRSAGAAGQAIAQVTPDDTQSSLYINGDKAGNEYSQRKQAAELASSGEVRRAPPSQTLAQTAPASPPEADLKKDASVFRAIGEPADKAAKSVEEAPSRTETGKEATVPPRVVEYQTAAGPAQNPVVQGPFIPMWRTDPRAGSPELLLCREVTIEGTGGGAGGGGGGDAVGGGGGRIIQGIWMDWPALQERLRSRVQDLLPGARLEPLLGRAPSPLPGRAQFLASIPALLIPGPAPLFVGDLLTPTHLTLLVTWLAVLASVVAIGLVLRASMELSDRRGRFVSAVTHELRTPLTTFCLYTEMLADGMVRDDAARGEYLGTLKGESRRLAGIVENVLDYARLGAGANRPNGHAPTSMGAVELLEGIRPSLARHAERHGMTLEVDLEPARGATVLADPQTVERILLNLVDNACKYAGEAADRRLHLGARAVGSRLEILFRDHGPGIPRREHRRIFEAFHRARRDAEGPKSGLGLGLALARGLARELGGDLELVRGRRDGTELRLTLPLAGTPQPH